MGACAAAYSKQFGELDDNLGYTKEEMLVFLKAYQDQKDDAGCYGGGLPSTYDIGPAVFHASLVTIALMELARKQPEFWERSIDSAKGSVRISRKGISFVESHPELLESAKEAMKGVGHIRRC